MMTSRCGLPEQWVPPKAHGLAPCDTNLQHRACAVPDKLTARRSTLARSALVSPIKELRQRAKPVHMALNSSQFGRPLQMRS